MKLGFVGWSEGKVSKNDGAVHRRSLYKLGISSGAVMLYGH